ncbi:AraC family transcriptional regulator [Anaerocolumna cellulosilytica]|uniref:AraC family transcriptional regulator n=1 Tax=Anaerocolumna cellulosilytica TaxID=433286 RepID=A0A6S6R5B3_9FIRM|nr:AraC family transcriptional regulator [Anaerocolumna cellulosilytica]MBB5194146.1 AraC-like DNA-binding protein [Anaerocolumna cellulosilytica]BCJ94642.1 AraC family transcriptional regulator [Anaerocolumna cellulosilytica]
MGKAKVYFSSRNKDIFIEHIKRINPYQMQQKHYHTKYEVYYLLNGDRNYFIQDRVYNVKKGDLILINSNVLHKTMDGFSDSHERIIIELEPDFFGGFLIDSAEIPLLRVFHKDYRILRLTEDEKKQLDNCFFKIIQEGKENDIDNNIALKIYLLDLLLVIEKLHNRMDTAEFEHPSKLHGRIAEVVAYMNDNYTNDIGLDLLADKFFISTAHLSRAFKKVTGFSFVEYLNNIRIQKAQKLLSETKYSIAEIAHMVGYQNSTHFGRMFKTITGSTPSEYKKLL